MLLKDYYQGETNKNKWYNFAEFLNNVSVPTHQQIIQKQKDFVGNMSDNFQNNPMIQAFNNDLQNIISDSDQANFDYHISQIEQAVSDISGKNTKEFVQEEIWMMENNFNSLITHYQSLVNYLGNLNNSNQIIKALTVFDKQLSRLEAAVQKYKTFGFPKTGSYLKRLNWVESQIKGFLLESEGVDFVRQHVPTDIKVLQTGQIYGPTFNILGNLSGSGKQIKEDLMLLIDKGIKIQYKIKNKNNQVVQVERGLTDFISDVENSAYKSIILTQQGYEALQKQLITGITAKATKTGHIRFGSVSLDNLSLVQSDQTKALMTLIKLKQKYNAQLIDQHEDYNLLFNYSISRHINYFIGKNNNLILTRKGITSIADFLKDQLSKGNYLHASKGIKLSSDTSKTNHQIGIDIS